MGAAGVSLAVPLAVGAVAVSAGLGGALTGFHAIGQAVTGPVIPDTRSSDESADVSARPDTGLLARAGVSARTRDAAAGRAARNAPRSRPADHSSAPLADDGSRADSSNPTTGAPNPSGGPTGSTTRQTDAAASTRTQPPQAPPPPNSRPAPSTGSRDRPGAGKPAAPATVPQVVEQLVTALGGLLGPAR